MEPEDHQGETDDSLAQGSRGADGEKWSGSGSLLEIDPKRTADRLDEG